MDRRGRSISNPPHPHIDQAPRVDHHPPGGVGIDVRKGLRAWFSHGCTAALVFNHKRPDRKE
jgi:hypothetical protein